MDQYHELQAHFVEDSNLKWLTVNAYDDYLGEYYPYDANVWVDGYWVGTAPVSLQVAAGRDHTVTVDWGLYSYYWGMVGVEKIKKYLETKPAVNQTAIKRLEAIAKKVKV